MHRCRHVVEKPAAKKGGNGVGPEDMQARKIYNAFSARRIKPKGIPIDTENIGGVKKVRDLRRAFSQGPQTHQHA